MNRPDENDLTDDARRLLDVEAAYGNPPAIVGGDVSEALAWRCEKAALAVRRREVAILARLLREALEIAGGVFVEMREEPEALGRLLIEGMDPELRAVVLAEFMDEMNRGRLRGESDAHAAAAAAAAACRAHNLPEVAAEDFQAAALAREMRWQQLLPHDALSAGEEVAESTGATLEKLLSAILRGGAANFATDPPADDA